MHGDPWTRTPPALDPPAPSARPARRDPPRSDDVFPPPLPPSFFPPPRLAAASWSCSSLSLFLDKTPKHNPHTLARSRPPGPPPSAPAFAYGARPSPPPPLRSLGRSEAAVYGGHMKKRGQNGPPHRASGLSLHDPVRDPPSPRRKERGGAPCDAPPLTMAHRPARGAADHDHSMPTTARRQTPPPRPPPSPRLTWANTCPILTPAAQAEGRSPNQGCAPPPSRKDPPCPSRRIPFYHKLSQNATPSTRAGIHPG
ncbi:hypothetical protein ES705_51113 [subsurface metagenome]